MCTLLLKNMPFYYSSGSEKKSLEGLAAMASIISEKYDFGE
jgi:hypothetical protein